MTVSVIIPTLNEERALPQTLPRTLALGFDEVLVVDGGSSDRTQQIVRDLLAQETEREVRGGQASAPEPRTPRLRLLASPPGRAAQMNVGAAASRGDVLLFLHADTQLPDNAKEAIVRALQEPECVGGRFDLRFDRDRPLSRLIACMINWRSRLSGIATGDQAIFVRRSVFERMGGFASIPLMEDIDLTRRLNRMGPVAYLRTQVVTSFRRWETRGPIRTILLMWLLRFLYWIGVNPHTLSRWYGHAR
ncbi:MAG: TIGR04283 family arsenosugar biosynthesis glycosyltransferase [Nitrospirota bacterium]|nr:TIGR04283 family arsenosugar biosynthesis glycosyltransferase [Nitrospirota bacterium]MDE3224383.1 TIGR04283 family arsenosugar biosynthesis glycosyltransferase [Nitrospirota bacterium]MDE3242143.1 TIGR04283 family arsenosugar biosynthesis glycosyltransferase [Nitrospirota bacterium]